MTEEADAEATRSLEEVQKFVGEIDFCSWKARCEIERAKVRISEANRLVEGVTLSPEGVTLSPEGVTLG